MEVFIILLVFWAALILLTTRLGSMSDLMSNDVHVRPMNVPGAPTPPEELRWVAPETDVDPVCGQTVRTADAKPTVHDGLVYYFCSRECREIFEAAPETYLQPTAPAPEPRQPAETDHG